MTRWRLKTNPFKKGDLIIYEAIDGTFKKAIVIASSGSSVQIDPVDAHAIHWAHWRQCKKLKPKEKKYKITKKQLAEAWDKFFYNYFRVNKEDSSKEFISFCKELGIEE